MSRTKHLLHRARKHFCSDVLSPQQNRRLQHKWVRCVSMLEHVPGETWAAWVAQINGEVVS